MKKLLFIFIFAVAASLAVTAQTSNAFVAFVADTTTNAETEYLVLLAPKAITLDYTVTLYVVSKNVSDSATVTAMPQWSPDNSLWFDLETSADTVNNAGTVANKAWTYPNAYGRYYRVKLISTGTGVTSFTGKIGIKSKG